ncbi:MAG: hypothetical protein K8L99_02520 [Anaerolineae bacterium]|nr:hypothetical protein [Anaerolineae bacterium]
MSSGPESLKGPIETLAIEPFEPFINGALQSLQHKKKVYRVGDGQTRFTLLGERPRSAEEKYQPTLEETIRDLGQAINNLTVDLSVAMSPVVQAAMHHWASNPETQQAVSEMIDLLETQPVDPKAEARRRSKEDLDRKRRELRQKRGR